MHGTYFTKAVVGLKRTSYTVLENVGVMEVCTIVYSSSLPCPIDFPFDVEFSTNDSSAGKCVVFSTTIMSSTMGISVHCRVSHEPNSKVVDTQTLSIGDTRNIGI